MSKTFKIDNKPRYLECLYSVPLTFDLKELGIEWKNIDDYYIKYTTLYVEFKDGTTKEYDGFLSEIDYKWADEEKLLTKNYRTIT
mgnify:FL=1